MEANTVDALTLDEVADLLRAGESERLEFKSKLPEGDDVAATLAAFANGSGGVLLVGVDNTGRPIGADAPDATSQRLASLARDACRPPVVVQLGQVAFGGIVTVWARVAGHSGRTYLVRGVRYIRVGPTTRADHSGLTREALTALVPPALDRFRGRDRELGRLHQTLGRSSVRLVVIEGISGIGKTALAAKLYKVLEGDGYRVFWLDCHGQTSFDDLTLELGRVARANGELALADLLDAGGAEGTPTDRVVRIVSALSRCRYVLFLDDYHLVPDPWFDQFLLELGRRSASSKAVLCVSRRPRLLELAPASTRKEIYIAVGLDPDACEKFLGDAGIDVGPGEARKIYFVCGRGHPKALSLFAALAGREPVSVLLRSLPRFEDKFRDEWLMPLLNGLSTDERQMVLDLSVFERRVPVDALVRLYPTRNVDTLVSKLTQSFILDYDGAEHIRMHELLRQFCYPLIVDPRSRHVEAGRLYVAEFELFEPDVPVGRKADALLAAWAQFIQAEDADVANKVLDRLRPLLMQQGQYSQLLILLDQTPIVDITKVQWRAIDRARILGLWDDVDGAVAVLDPLATSHDKRLAGEAALVLAAIYNSHGRSTEALDVLTTRFSRGAVSDGASIRLALRVAEAYLISGDPTRAFELLLRVSRISEDRGDHLSLGRAAYLMASVSMAQGDAKRALDLALQGRELLREWPRDAALSQLQAGLAWAALKARDQALEALEAADRVLTEIGDRVSSATCRRHITRVREELQ